MMEAAWLQHSENILGDDCPVIKAIEHKGHDIGQLLFPQILRYEQQIRNYAYEEGNLRGARMKEKPLRNV